MLTFLPLAAALGSLVIVALASALLTGFAYWYAQQRGWLAVPNARSSHTVPTPSSGGVGLVAVSAILIAVLGGSGRIAGSVALALLGGVGIAIVGWVDDRRQLPVAIRLIAYTVATAWALWWIGGFRQLFIGPRILALGSTGAFLAGIAVVAFSNIYNFMDGIDGLIASVAIVAGLMLAWLFFRAGAAGLATVSAVLAATSAGFLMWNWHPAKVFMGDVGSVFLGFVFAVLAVTAEERHVLPALLWVILFAPFLVDGVATTMRRMFTGERWYEAHRSFAYQRAVARGHAHGTVATGAVILECIMAAIAAFAAFHPTLLLHATGAALLVSAGVWTWYQFPKSARRNIA